MFLLILLVLAVSLEVAVTEVIELPLAREGLMSADGLVVPQSVFRISI